MSRTGTIVRLLACLCLVATSTATKTWVVSETGVGPFKIGMKLHELNAVLHEKLARDPQDDEACYYVTPSPHGHIAFMMIDGRVARVDVDTPGIATSSGIQVGDSEAHARQVYGSQMKVTPHKYVDTGHYVTVRSVDGHYGIRFETDNGKITSFYAGTYEAIQYVEGCE